MQDALTKNIKEREECVSCAEYFKIACDRIQEIIFGNIILLFICLNDYLFRNAVSSIIT